MGPVAVAEWAGAEDLRALLVPVESITRHPQNPKRGDVEEIKKSLQRFGQVRPILVDKGTIIAGNHTYLAACELGWAEVAVVNNDFKDETEALAYLVADNRLGDLGEYDRAELLLFVEELGKNGRWEGTGYQPDDLAHLRALEEAANRPAPEPASRPIVDPTPVPEFREVVLLFDESQQGEFGANVRKLRAAYDLEGISDTVLRAVREEAFRLNQGEPDA